MSIPYTNFANLKLAETTRSDDTSDEANRRRELRRKQQSASIKIHAHNKFTSKNLLDEVLDKNFVQSKTKSIANQPDIGRHQGLPVPARLKNQDDQEKLDGQKKLSDVDAQLRLDNSLEGDKKHDQFLADSIKNLSKSSENSEVTEALERTRLANDFTKEIAANLENSANAANSEINLEASFSNKKLPLSPLAMLTTQLDKLKNQILLIDENRLQSQTNPHDLQELAALQTRMATSLDFLEGYAEGVIKDEADRHQFEQSCKDLREQIAQSERNFNVALENTFLIQPNQPNQPKLSNSLFIQSQKVNEIGERMATSNKQELAERARLLEESSEVLSQEDKQKSSRLDDAYRTQRIRGAKQDRDNAETTLPLLVQRSV